ncbi:DUF4245 domain-containing protein [Salinibacterium sp. SYSU T00001]|uniref:DUF4245 domain-containing protein n=1 Tax=Homoserinimonas sedimenticola TaxID=2986805 RepID=UPI002236263C|nr:DUF4245 domain-containing protein [Salinibacterium sedimenticola]MCW4386451.1 DUF4245 domain-containing protein [Salinibacterium sedimenticola]
MSRSEGSNRQAPIVAELGRPETPEETAARKAASSQRYRDSKTPINLVVALVASLAIVLVTVMIVVRPDAPAVEPTDYQAVAAQVQPDFEETLAAPVLPEGWWANAARISRGGDGVSEWYIGFVTPTQNFAAVTQGIDANPTWLQATLEGALATGTTSLAGHTWDIYDHRNDEDAGNFAFAMTTVVGASTVVIHGTATEDEFETLARATIAAVQETATEESP